ncbi:hypothetical protein L1987_76852 [Smallanthus sonchifolius]|uniref:Uncharacterized protein n=1 Tax=Smallanthus sonchifolius TaxID=185202 RepID=A0ACB8Z8K3_9ASTR|nr:hypothetical protein L1987_76852 [Smallanthus sonchifolius]
MAATVIQPRRLKDFLQDQNLPFPRSRRSAISVFLHAAVSSVKSSSILRRSISRRFSNKNRSTSRLPEPTMARTTSVTVKDILRWKSFRDLADPAEINPPPLLESTVESPRCTTATATATTTTTSSVGTPKSSWCDSDFTDDDSPACFRGFSGDMDVTGKKNFHINIAGGERNIRDPEDRIVLVEEDEQFSPISVLDFTQQHEETFSPFHQTLADMERRSINLKQQIQNFENLIEVHDDMNKHVELYDTESFKIEEQAIRLMDHVKTTSSIEEWDLNLDCLLIDFFRDELNNGNLESRVLSVAKCWVRGEMICIGEMDKRWNLKDLEDDQKEIVIEMEKMMLNCLLDELTMDLVNV